MDNENVNGQARTEGAPSQRCIDWVMAHVDLVAAERERWAAWCEYQRDQVTRLIDAIGPKDGHEYREGRRDAFDDAAAAIRARGDR